MNLTREELDLVQNYAERGMNPEDIALLMHLPEQEFCDLVSNKFSDASKSYRRGRVLTMLAINTREIEYASKGSPQAVKLYHEKILPRQ